MALSADITELVNNSWLDLRILTDPFSTRPVVSTTNWARTSPSTFADRSMSGYRRFAVPGTCETCFSTWNSKYVWSDTGPVPPTTPLAIPPATPLPLKSASSVIFLDRSISGSTSGILMGAVSTWNPFGGGGAATISGGGGAFSSGGGGSSFFISTNSTFSAFGFSSASLAWSVPYTA